MNENIFRYYYLHYIQQRMEKVHYSFPYLIHVRFCNKLQVTAIIFFKENTMQKIVPQ